MAERLRVLVVEHDQSTAGLLASQLAKRGIEPVCVATPIEASARAEREKFDGIFLDWSLPGAPGEVVARRIRRSPSNHDIPLICLVPRVGTNAVAEAGAESTPFRLLKPFREADVDKVLDLCGGALVEEHCRYMRMPLRIPLSCSWKGGWAAGKTVNVSSTGLLMGLEVSPRKGTAVTLQMEVPGLDWRLSMEAQVARARSNKEIGVQFARPSRRGLNPLLRLAHQNAGEPESKFGGIERRSTKTVQPPGSAGSSPGSGDHPHRPPLPSQPDPVHTLEDDKDSRPDSGVN